MDCLQRGIEQFSGQIEYGSRGINSWDPHGMDMVYIVSVWHLCKYAELAKMINGADKGVI